MLRDSFFRYKMKRVFRPFWVCGIVTTFVMLILQTRLEYKKARVDKALTVLKERYFKVS